jgi:hypothetical protein
MALDFITALRSVRSASLPNNPAVMRTNDEALLTAEVTTIFVLYHILKSNPDYRTFDILEAI